MRSIGFFMIVIGLVLYIIGMIIGLNVDYSDYPEHIEYVGWMIGFCQILVFAGIGFILYDVAMKGEDKGFSKLKERFTKLQEQLEEEQAEIEESVMVCSHCNQKFRFPKSLIGSNGECPLCDKEVTLKELPPPPSSQ